MASSECQRPDDDGCYFDDFINNANSDWGSSTQSNVTSPLEGSFQDANALLSYWQANGPQGQRIAFHEAAEALKQLKDTRRKCQNRSAQRAYHERQQKRVKELKDTIEDLQTDRKKLRDQVKGLESDLNRLQVQTSIQEIRLQRRHTSPDCRACRRPSVAPRMVKDDSTGWMLKHMYGLGEADDDLFAVFEIKSGSES